MTDTRLQADELNREIRIEPSSSHSIDVVGSFQFDSATPPEQHGARKHGRLDRAGKKEDKKKAKKEKKEAKERKKQGLPPVEPVEEKKDEGVPFSLRDINLQVARGGFWFRAIRVGH